MKKSENGKNSSILYLCDPIAERIVQTSASMKVITLVE